MNEVAVTCALIIYVAGFSPDLGTGIIQSGLWGWERNRAGSRPSTRGRAVCRHVGTSTGPARLAGQGRAARPSMGALAQSPEAPAVTGPEEAASRHHEAQGVC